MSYTTLMTKTKLQVLLCLVGLVSHSFIYKKRQDHIEEEQKNSR